MIHVHSSASNSLNILWTFAILEFSMRYFSYFSSGTFACRLIIRDSVVSHNFLFTLTSTRNSQLQSDIVHQSVYELVHSEDREELQRQLMWNSFLPAELSGLPLAEALAPDKVHHLERSFTVRFRCLLDNTSGFLVCKKKKCWMKFIIFRDDE